VALLKSINGAREVLIVQHGNQLSDCFVGVARSRFEVFGNDPACFAYR
jgi:hypothetical protein